MNKKNTLVYYILVFILLGLWQILDWYFSSEDPIWHIMFYLFFMPAISFTYCVLQGYKYKFYIPVLTTFVCVTLVYIIFANGGLCFDTNCFTLTLPSTALSLFGTFLSRILFKNDVKKD